MAGGEIVVAIGLVATAAALGAGGALLFMRIVEPRLARWGRIAFDLLGVLAVIPAFVMFYALTDLNSGGQMTAFGALLIYSVVTLGIVPLLGMMSIVLVFRLILRLKRRIRG